MIMIDPRKAVASIITKRKGTPEPDVAAKLTEDTAGELDPRHMAAEDVMAAFHSKDIHHLKEALANFHDLHMMHKEREEHMGGHPRDEEHYDMESQRPEL
jgi:hypothetical protein